MKMQISGEVTATTATEKRKCIWKQGNEEGERGTATQGLKRRRFWSLPNTFWKFLQYKVPFTIWLLWLKDLVKQNKKRGEQVNFAISRVFGELSLPSRCCFLLLQLFPPQTNRNGLFLFYYHGWIIITLAFERSPIIFLHVL